LQQRRPGLAQALAAPPARALLGDLAAGLSAADGLALATLLQALKPRTGPDLERAEPGLAGRGRPAGAGRRLPPPGGRPRALLRQGLLPAREGQPDPAGATPLRSVA
jgi:hypothetical protein